MTKNARAVLKQFVEAIAQDDISPTMSTGFEKAYQNALAVLQEPDTSPAEAKAVACRCNEEFCDWEGPEDRAALALFDKTKRICPKCGSLFSPKRHAPADAELQYKSMFEAAISALAAIDDALGIDADGCNEPEITLDEIRRLKTAAEADKRDAVQEALEGLALIFEARAIAPFPQTGSRDLRGFSFSQEWNAAREADKNSAAIIRTYAQSLAIAAQKEAGR